MRVVDASSFALEVVDGLEELPAFPDLTTLAGRLLGAMKVLDTR